MKVANKLLAGIGLATIGSFLGQPHVEQVPAIGTSQVVSAESEDDDEYTIGKRRLITGNTKIPANMASLDHVLSRYGE